MTRLAGLIAAALALGGDAKAQNCRTAGGSVAAYAAPAYSYYPRFAVNDVVVQQDYFVEPQVVEVVEIHKGVAAKAFGARQYGHYAYYPDQVAVVREVVRRRVVVIEEEPETPR